MPHITKTRKTARSAAFFNHRLSHPLNFRQRNRFEEPLTGRARVPARREPVYHCGHSLTLDRVCRGASGTIRRLPDRDAIPTSAGPGRCRRGDGRPVRHSVGVLDGGGSLLSGENSCLQCPLSDSLCTRVWSVIQLTSHVLPPSSENDCSKWAEFWVI